jgi:hypothetical protein
MPIESCNSIFETYETKFTEVDKHLQVCEELTQDSLKLAKHIESELEHKCDDRVLQDV